MISGKTMKKKRAWSMPEEEARPFLQMLEERVRSSEIEVRHRDALIRLRQVIEEELTVQPSPIRAVRQTSTPRET